MPACSALCPARLQKLVAISGNAPADPILRLAALCVYMAEDAQRLREKLRLSNEEFQRLERVAKSLVPLHGSESPPQPQDLKALLFHRGRQTALDAIMLAQAEACPSHDGQWETARIFLRDTPEPRLPFSGADVMARGVANGRAIGEALKDLQVRWIDAGFPEDPASLAHLLAEVGRPK